MNANQAELFFVAQPHFESEFEKYLQGFVKAGRIDTAREKFKYELLKILIEDFDRNVVDDAPAKDMFALGQRVLGDKIADMVIQECLQKAFH